jgi:hypothetical protein
MSLEQSLDAATQLSIGPTFTRQEGIPISGRQLTGGNKQLF